jgi:hypothetical protein
MTLWVTKQNQEFITTSDLELADIELVNATVELVGEPGNGNYGDTSGNGSYATTSTHKTTINTKGVNDVGQTSTVFGLEAPNLISQKTHLNHGHLNVGIVGMTEGHQFRQDATHQDNRIYLSIPTDLGLMSARDKLASWPPTPISIEAVKLEQRLRVESAFFGNGAAPTKVARFVEDWADATSNRNDDGTVKWFTNNDEGTSSIQQCIVPSNCIVGMKLVFNIRPRAIL